MHLPWLLRRQRYRSISMTVHSVRQQLWRRVLQQRANHIETGRRQKKSVAVDGQRRQRVTSCKVIGVEQRCEQQRGKNDVR